MTNKTDHQIRLDGISKSYTLNGEPLPVLDDISFAVSDDEFLTLVGPSGCGKSTVLNIIADWIVPDDGTVDIQPSRPEVRVGFVFQDPTLLDWRTVRQNLKFALQGLGIPKTEHDERIENALELVGLSDFADQYPPTLSGGMQQRVGFARAFCVGPDVLLMDEPFSSLDELTARTLRRKVLDIWHDTPFTAILVTHNIEEAVYLSDEVVVLSDTPTVIRDSVSIDIDRPRDPESPEVLEHEQAILKTLGVPT